MTSQWLMLGGKVLEVAGAFFVAVEAIKLPNLCFSRDQIRKASQTINPVLRFLDKDTSETRATGRWLNARFCFITALGLFVPYAILQLTGHSLTHAWQWFSRLVPGPYWIDIVVAIPVSLLLLLLSGGIIMSAYSLVVLLLDAAIAILSFVEKNTASGVVGILGFLLFLIGAVIGVYVQWIGA